MDFDPATGAEIQKVRPALAKFQDAVAMVCRTLESQSAEDWLKPIADQAPIQTRFGLFLVCVAHINNHVGQMQWLVQQFGHNTGEPPAW